MNTNSHIIFFCYKLYEFIVNIISTTSVVEFVSNRMLVKDTDNGKRLRAQVEDLKKLLEAYRSGKVRQRN